jgi:hypothetical protein
MQHTLTAGSIPPAWPRLFPPLHTPVPTRRIPRRPAELIDRRNRTGRTFRALPEDQIGMTLRLGSRLLSRSRSVLLSKHVSIHRRDAACAEGPRRLARKRWCRNKLNRFLAWVSPADSFATAIGVGIGVGIEPTNPSAKLLADRLVERYRNPEAVRCRCRCRNSCRYGAFG